MKLTKSAEFCDLIRMPLKVRFLPTVSEAKIKGITPNQALVAQWIEQEPSNLLVAGSIPAEGAFDAS